MNKLIVALLLAPAVAFAQKRNHFYVDLGLNKPGGSATYDHNLTRNFSLGGGIDVYDWKTTSTNLKTGIYADMRPHWQIGKSQILLPLDIGLAIYGSRAESANSSVTYSTIGTYVSFGLGYCYRITRRGGGPYATFIMKGYGHKETENDKFLQKHVEGVYDASSMFSVGFKF
jgi:hypothetical protein